MLADSMNNTIKSKIGIDNVFNKNNVKYILMLFLYSASADRIVYGSKDSTIYDAELGVYLQEDDKQPILQTLSNLDNSIQDMLLEAYDAEDLEEVAFIYAQLFIDTLKAVAPKIVALKGAIEKLGNILLPEYQEEYIEWTTSCGVNCNLHMLNNIKDENGDNVKHTITYWRENSQGSFEYTPLKVLDPKSKRTALNPRFTQSIDANLLLRVSAKCADKKIWIRGVHDSYYSQINHFWDIHTFYKEALVESMEEMNVITQQVFGKQVQKRVSNDIKDKVRDTILNSKYMTWF
jgi:DNA-directed RNA polymerase